MKINKVFLMVVATVVVLITFFILWMFHGGADQSKVIIEENVQKDNKVSSVQKNYSELSMSSNANSLINQNNKPIEHDMNNKASNINRKFFIIMFPCYGYRRMRYKYFIIIILIYSNWISPKFMIECIFFKIFKPLTCWSIMYYL